MDKLSELIHSLTPSEKRYFKLFAKNQSGKSVNNYIYLFDFLNKQDKYDEKKVHLHFKGAKFLKQLHVTKYHLYQLILKSLRAFRAGKSVDSQVFLFFENIELLFEKGLLLQCRQEIDKAEAFMQAHNKYLDLLRLSRWKREVHVKIDKNLPYEAIEKSLEEERYLLKLVDNLMQYTHLTDKLRYQVTRNAFNHFRKDLKKHPLLQDEKTALTLPAKRDFHKARTLCLWTSSTVEELVALVRRELDLFEENPVFLQNNLLSYALSLNSYCIVTHELGNMPLFLEALDKLRNIKTTKVPVALHTKTLYFICGARYYGEKKEENGDISRFLKEMVEWFHASSEQLSKAYQLVLLTNIIHIYFVLEDYEAALDYSNQFLAQGNTFIRADTHRLARLRILLIHIDLGNLELLEYLTRSHLRFIQKEKETKTIDIQTDIAFIHFIQKKILELNSKKKLQEAYVAFFEEVKRLAFNSNRVEEYHFLLMWVKSKALGVSFQDTFEYKDNIKQSPNDKNQKNMKYIALLRGINVSGQKKIKMLDLRNMCEKMGWHDVQTYIQSGNIIFESNEEDKSVLETNLKEAIQTTFGYEVPVMIMTQAYLKQVADQNPFLKKDPSIDIKLLHVTFLGAKPADDLVVALQEKDYGTDEFEVLEDKVYLYFPNGYGRTKLTNNIFEKKLKVDATTRNWRTVLKLKDF
ncbi:DUF1697 domain-containing protein [Aureispira sp. CCB-E]|uniref:DUF1697 domain-containing protein n=1 Tax=Aureispira sp. CCB-E TaxID=3051121 RepID=UPI0028692F23|nr:DUF1697 domain-containing protein [Aureispira sp. CCB-E]WMX15876.1 DUF1697 domain-containing protein [Aureispira sp. CCB-E]